LWYNAIMKRSVLEPGFMQAFRLFVVTQIVFWVVIGPILIVVQMARGNDLAPDAVTSMTVIERLTLPNVAPIIIMQVALLALLLLPQAPRRLGHWFLPLTLLFGLIPLLIGYYWWPSENPLQTPFVIFFFVMLVLVAWQYPFRYVLIYVLGLTLYQYWLASPMTGLPRSVDVSWLVLQGAMMLLVGYVIVQLISIQREQQTALANAYEQQAAANARLKQYAATVEELTISRERNRLARELHDSVTQALYGVTLYSEAASGHLAQGHTDRVSEHLRELQDTAQEALAEMRLLVFELRPPILQEQGLVAALQARLQAVEGRAGLRTEFKTDLEERLPLDVEEGLYRIALEALNNALRHAGAQNIKVHLRQEGPPGGAATLEVTDDGMGFDPATVHERGGLGLAAMDERAAALGGQLTVWSEPGSGTQIRAVWTGDEGGSSDE
jgi:signal transduction histidine kinase